MGSVAKVIHRVVVVVDHIAAVMRPVRTAVPHASGNVNVVIVNTGVDDGNNNAAAIVACATIIVPDSWGVHLVDMPSVVLGIHGISLSKVGDHLSWLVTIDIVNVAAGC